MLKKVLKFFLQNRFVIIIIFIGSLTWSIIMVRSGIKYDYGVGFWGANAHDGLWHVALAESLAKGSLNNPVFAGYKLTNYHMGFDLLLAFLNKLTSISVLTLYFQILPPILAILIGILSYKFIVVGLGSKNSALWSLFFIYFGGGLGYLITLARGEGLGGDSMFWIQSSANTLINPPFALSLIVLLTGLLMLDKYKVTGKIKYFLFSSLLFIILSQIKIYAAVVALGALFIASTYEAIIKKQYRILAVFFFASTISLLLLLVISRSFNRLLVFYPLWFLETLMLFEDRFHWIKYFQAMTSYKQGGLYFKAVIFYAASFLLFIVGNLGTKIIGGLTLLKWLKEKLNWLKLFLLSAIAIGILVPMFFIQKGTPWNTIQFSYYSVFFLAILAGFAIPFFNKSIKKREIKLVFSLVLILLTIPITFATLSHYISRLPPTAISNNEITALNFLRAQPDGVVLSLQLYNDSSLNLLEKKIPISIYLYESTAYIPAFSGHPDYFDDEVNLNILGINWIERKVKIQNFLKDTNSIMGRNFLRAEGISYIYLVKRIGVGLDEQTLGIKNIFNNQEVIVYRVN